LSKSTFKISGINFFSLILLFVSNLLIASKFGAGIDMDIYISSSSIPLFLSTILITSLSVNFTPLFFSEKNTNNRSVFYSIINGVVIINILIILVLMFIFNIFIVNFYDFLVPGYTYIQKDFYRMLVLYQTPYIIISFMNEILSNLLYCHEKFLVPVISKIFNPIILILYIVFSSYNIDVIDLIIISTISVLVQSALLIYSLFRVSYFNIFRFSLTNNVVIKYFKLSLPIVFIVIFTKIIPVFDRYLVSDLYAGSVSHLSYAFKLYSQIGPILSAGIMITIYPSLADYASKNDINNVKFFASNAIKKLFFLSAPITVLFCFYGSYIIQFLYLRGKFNLNDSIIVSNILSIYLLALPYSLVGDILAKLFYVFNDTITPVVIGIIETIIYIYLAVYLKPYFGIYSLPISFAVYFNLSWFNAFLIKRKLGGSGRKIISLFMLSIFASFISAMIIYFPICWSDTLLLKMIFLFIGLISYFSLMAFVFKSDIAVEYYLSVKNYLVESINNK
jgi:putative peptidoglycan lipid II flippase